ncbi:MAG: UDP-glucose 4-epimerase GalE, partial [Planctomycetota bacterium]
ENLFPEAAFIKGDIRNAADIEAAMAHGFDGVVHLAAFKHVGLSMEQPELFAVNNLSGTINVLNAMLKHGVSRIVFSSSASVFGEPQYLPLDERHPTNPESFYGFTKLEMERLMLWYDRLKQIRYASLRYFNAAGYDVNGRVTGIEAITTNLIPVLMEVAVGKRPQVQIFGTDYETRDGSCIRDYIHVNDLATAHVQALDHMVRHDDSHVFNLGTATGTSVLEVLEQTRAITGQEIPAEMSPRRPGDPSQLFAESKKIQTVLGWQAQHSDLQTIIETTWKVYRQHFPA